MSMNEKKAYEIEQVKFWTEKKDNLTTVGDYLGRLPSVELLNIKKGDKILDAGCGAGFTSRLIARKGADVWGCDRSQSMIDKAKDEEAKNHLGINFTKADIAEGLPYEDNFFDIVSCIAVLIHDSPEECLSFLKEAFRVLKPSGRVIVSIMHPDLFMPNSPSRTDKASWVQYTPLEDKPMTVSQKFNEDYRDSAQQLFKSTVWYHPLDIFPKLFTEAGFTIESEHHQFVTPEILKVCNQSGEKNYRAFYQILGKKFDL